MTVLVGVAVAWPPTLGYYTAFHDLLWIVILVLGVGVTVGAVLTRQLAVLGVLATIYAFGFGRPSRPPTPLPMSQTKDGLTITVNSVDCQGATFTGDHSFAVQAPKRRSSSPVSGSGSDANHGSRDSTRTCVRVHPCDLW